MLTVGSLFSGIGGWDLGLERAGMRVVWQAEADLYCRAVLRRHWPDIPCFEDVRDIHDCHPVDVLCGGFPCQPVSLAGRGLAQADERWLWPEFDRLVRLLRPRYVLVENVPGLLARGMGDVLGGLAACGYDAEWDCLPALSVGAPHRRDRVWIVAYPNGERRDGRAGELREGRGAESADGRAVAHASGSGLEGRRGGALRPGAAPGGGPGTRGLPDADSERSGRSRLSEGQGGPTVLDVDRSGPRVFGRGVRPSGQWSVEPDVGRVADGVPARSHRLRALGNALVPQVAEWIGRRIVDHEAEGRLAA